MRRRRETYRRDRISISQSSASSQQRNMNPEGRRLYCSHLCMRLEAHPILCARASWDRASVWRASTRRSTVRSQLGSMLTGFLRCVNSLDGIEYLQRCFKSHVISFLRTIESACWYASKNKCSTQIDIPLFRQGFQMFEVTVHEQIILHLCSVAIGIITGILHLYLMYGCWLTVTLHYRSLGP